MVQPSILRSTEWSSVVNPCAMSGDSARRETMPSFAKETGQVILVMLSAVPPVTPVKTSYEKPMGRRKRLGSSNGGGTTTCHTPKTTESFRSSQ